ncbi:kinase-like protein [Trametes maxima]|nr:kinase-like protein [Trametes maxima]
MSALTATLVRALYRLLGRIGRFRLPWVLWRLFPSAARHACYKRLFSTAEDHLDYRGAIRKLPCGWVLKMVNRSPFQEVHNTRFVERNTSIPVPHILDVIQYTIPGFPDPQIRGLIVMTYIEGVLLSDWVAEHTRQTAARDAALAELDAALSSGDDQMLDRLIEQMRTMSPPVLEVTGDEALLGDLRDALRELRSIPPPSGAVSGLNNQPVEVIRAGSQTRMGPFPSQREFKAALFEFTNPTLFPERMPTLRRLAGPVQSRNHRIVFTHGDLHGLNILVKDGRLAGIIDWETAGWLPEYWEHTSIEGHITLEPLFHQFWDAVGAFGPNPYPEELALEFALWLCTGTSTVVGPDVNLRCPR